MNCSPRFRLDACVGLDVCGKSRPTPGFDPRTVQPVASRYMDRAIPVTPPPPKGPLPLIGKLEGMIRGTWRGEAVLSKFIRNTECEFVEGLQ